MDEIKNVLPSVLSSLQNPDKKVRSKLTLEWSHIVGKKFAKNTRPSLAKDGTLYVWVNQSVLAFEINQCYKASILKRAQAVIGEQEAKQIRIRVGELR